MSNTLLDLVSNSVVQVAPKTLVLSFLFPKALCDTSTFRSMDPVLEITITTCFLWHVHCMLKSVSYEGGVEIVECYSLQDSLYALHSETEIGPR